LKLTLVSCGLIAYGIAPINKEDWTVLILTRRVDESIKVGEDITVTVLGIKGTQVRIGIQAPKDMSVDREEVRERKQHEPRPK